MSRAIVAFVISFLVAFSVQAQEGEAPASVVPTTISDTEAVIIAKTIQAHVQSVKNKGLLKLYDRTKNEIVNLRFDRIIANDPDCLAYTEEGLLAICAECTEMAGKKNADEGDAYTLWFFVSLGDLISTQVQDVAIKSVNGEDVPTWMRNEAGELKVIIGAGGAVPSTESEE